MKLIIATHNDHKIVEFKRILEPIGFEVVTADITEAEENGKTFMDNAFIKAESAMKETGMPAVADDSGVCVDFLGGEPGVYSARFAPQGEKRKKILKLLEGVAKEKRGAYFASAICCVFPNGDRVEAEGRCYGRIADESKGENGFGYDSIFIPDDMEKTFGEATDEEKDQRSHRGLALKEFAVKLQEYINRNGD